MKKEFKAPIVEAKELSTLNNVMDDVVLIGGSDEKNGTNLTEISDAAEGFKIWKGFKNN